MENSQFEPDDLDQKQGRSPGREPEPDPGRPAGHAEGAGPERTRWRVSRIRSTLVKHQADSMTKDQPWVRENMKAFKGSPEEKALLERYARPLDQPEDRLNRLQKEISDLNERENQAEGEREQIVQTIVMDESL